MPQDQTPEVPEIAPKPETAPVVPPAPVPVAPPAPPPPPTPTPEAPKIHTPAVEPLKPLPATPPPTTAQTGAGHIDLGKVLLPKKETPGKTVDSATRVNAAVLLEQELAAGSEGTAAQTPDAKKETAPTPAPAPKVDEPLVKPITTFQRDIESVVTNEKVSVLSIATAEAERRSKGGIVDPNALPPSNWLRNGAFIAGGIIFLVAASGALAYLVTRPSAVAPTISTDLLNSPFILVDSQKEITIAERQNRASFMASLDAARKATSISLGLISQLVITQSSTTINGTELQPVGAQQFLELLAPHIPDRLLRALTSNYLLGVHSYNDNQAFLIASGYSYEQTYAAMLEWEAFMEQDLVPLFSYKPRVRIPEEGTGTTATPQFLTSNFVDRIVENRDTRALVNENGDIKLLWTMLDRNTLVIATNDATLREIITRIKNAPQISVPRN